MSDKDTTETPQAVPAVGAQVDRGVRALALASTWRRSRPGCFDEEAHNNLIAAIPHYPARPMSTMEIWHAAKAPKPAYTLARFWLRDISDVGLGIERIGGENGPQFYRWMDLLEQFLDKHWDDTRHLRPAP